MTTLSAVLKVWKKTVLLVEDGNHNEALRSFESIPDKPLPGLPRARILFNLGCMNLILGHYAAALEKFTETIEKDEHLAIAYMQRGCTNFKLSRYGDSERDFLECHKRMRNASVIDYTQLGLWHRLHASEPLYNAGVAAAKQNQLTKSIDYLLQARQAASEKKHEAAKKALELADRNPKAVSSLDLMTLEATHIFRPPKDRADVSVRDHDFLGKAKVVASRDNKDVTTGFKGRNALSETGSKSAPTSPSSSRDRSRSDTALNASVLGHVRRAISPNPPKTRAYGQTGGSSTVPKQRGPLTPLPSSNASASASQRPPGLPPRLRTPPAPQARTHSKPTMRPSREVTTEPQEENKSRIVPPVPARPPSFGVAQRVGDLVTVQLTCNTTTTLKVKNRSSLSELIQKCANQFDLPTGSFQLWYQSNGEYYCIESEIKMQNVWKTEVRNSQLSLWCFSNQQQ